MSAYPPPPDYSNSNQQQPPPGAYPPPQQGAYPPPQQGAYPPPQQGAYPQAQQPAVVVVQPTSMTVGAVTYGDAPVNINCAACGVTVMTETEQSLGMMVWLVAGILCFLGCGLCAWIPCVIPSFKDVTHKCPQCKRILGQCKRM